MYKLSQFGKLVNRLCGVAIAFVATITVNAQQWIDVTETYVKNPSYVNNDYSYWLGTQLSGYNPKENAEHYQKVYDTYQEITGLTPGKYRVSLDAFYRMGSASDDYSRYTSGNYSSYQLAKLYATSSVKSYEVAIVPSSSGAVAQSLGGNASGVGNQTGGWWGGGSYSYYIPNNMEAAYYWFEAGYYDNVLECEVGSDGKLTIGIKKESTQSGDWTCIDNWKLEYYGQVVKLTKITLAETTITMSVDEVRELTYTCEPNNATNKKLSWSSSNSSVASVDENGVVTAYKKGTVTIKATAIDGSGVSASCVVTVKDANPASSENLVINELMAANIDVYRDPSTNYGSWVELYNPSSQGVKLGGLYISDDPNDLTKHELLSDYGILPAKGYAILNFDHYSVWTPESYRQIDDKLDCDGGTIIVSDGTTIIAQQDYPAAIGRVSYARTIDGAGEWTTCGNPSPGSSNAAAGGFATEQIGAPEVNQPGCLFSGTLNVKVTIPSGATLKYTTDGTAPTLKNGQTSSNGSFSVNNTTCYRFRLFKDGYLPSRVVTCSYIQDNGNEPFPIISIVANKDDIDGSSDYALFKQGQYGRPGNGQTSKCNWNMDWDRPVSFEYFNTDGECVVAQEVDMATCGGWSRAWNPHSFKLKATKIYDFENTFSYQFFDEKPYLNNKTLQVRNGGNDNSCRIKDPAIQRIVASSGLYVDYQSWQPAHVYVNGQSFAVLNVREPNNKHYAYANYGIDTDEMEQFEISPDSGYVQMVGTGEYFNKLYELSANATNSDTYEEICNLVDIDEYINYMAVELYTGNWDWPQNNVKGFRSLADGKFHFVLFDLDGALSTDTPLNTFAGKKNYQFDTLHGYDYSLGRSIEGNRRNLEIKFVTIFLNLLNNAEFKKKFIDTYCIVGGSVFTPARVRSIVEEMSSYLGKGNYVYPSNTANNLISSFSSSRQNTMTNHIKSYFGLSNSSQQTVSLSSDVEGAQILIDGMEVPTGKFSGTLFAPITLKAVAPAGYTFVGWSGSGSSGETKTLFSTGSEWYYADSNMSSTNWKQSSSAFQNKGKAPLGYNSNNSLTTNLTKNRVTYYFGRNVTIADSPASTDVFTLNFTVDDGAIVYVNGVEAGRYNMPSGNVGDETVASTYAQGNPDTGSMTLATSLFKKGNNYIAVEIHNNQSSSSDVYWDAELTHTVMKKNTDSYVSTDEEYTITSSGTYSLIACFEPIDEDSLIAQGTTPIKINEVSAANTVAVNDNFKKKDWIELYNTTGEAIDVAGMYLSDKEDKPKKYQIPAGVINTVIEPYGHLVIWADEKDGVSQLHTNFKLGNSEGEKVILTSEDESWQDVLTYTSHLGTQSVGLYPDGSNNVYVMDAPTIGSQNTIDSYASFYMYYVPSVDPEPEPDNITDVLPADVIAENYYSASGAFVGTSRRGLPSGVYVVKYTKADGTINAKKILVK